MDVIDERNDPTLNKINTLKNQVKDEVMKLTLTSPKVLEVSQKIDKFIYQVMKDQRG
ncbi:Spo0E family sporulation regulatory protein-aspartic acid phosphatase [Iocasia frigidifontis]|uniref:Spo0E family sporulation regulatory protein-aspartic acid phosphatase n=1 Tax=Iocasia fonsfrigidae TaxID=2682810 RepID=A0A8A7KCD6_9FIRM|nr:aspartyl-phosphate phosphatase Spo0E family protein [Halocella sp. SP3-1]QTL98910.1 Spo0E family sporulation regulatory protein-aspartic acid phosphatase [Iocasia fonsfrigidae]